MMSICPECGSQIPPDADFCYHCGRVRDIPCSTCGPEQLPTAEGRCRRCGEELAQDSVFCRRCGFIASDLPFRPARPKLTLKRAIGIVLALVPGFFCIFGLGHIWFRRYRRAAMLLFISVPLFYLTFINGPADFTGTMVFLFSIFLYFIQAMEVMTLALLSEDRDRGD